MLDHPVISAPFFEIGPKAYLVGDEVLDLARAADASAARHGVGLIFTTPFPLISRVAAETSHLLVCAPHMDPLRPGRGLADILPEELKASGADGVMLNHSERPVSYAVLEETIERAREVGLFTIVCASSMAEIRAVALLRPDIIVAEPSELIGTGTTSDLSYMTASTEAVREIDARILVLQAAGISGGDDVERVIRSGADATGSSSAVALASDRAAMAEEMLAAVRRGWNARNRHQEPTLKEQPA